MCRIFNKLARDLSSCRCQRISQEMVATGWGFCDSGVPSFCALCCVLFPLPPFHYFFCSLLLQFLISLSHLILDFLFGLPLPFYFFPHPCVTHTLLFPSFPKWFFQNCWRAIIQKQFKKATLPTRIFPLKGKSCISICNLIAVQDLEAVFPHSNGCGVSCESQLRCSYLVYLAGHVF